MNYRGKCSLCHLKVTEIDGIEYVKPGRTIHKHKKAYAIAMPPQYEADEYRYWHDQVPGGWWL